MQPSGLPRGCWHITAPAGARAGSAAAGADVLCCPAATSPRRLPALPRCCSRGRTALRLLGSTTGQCRCALEVPVAALVWIKQRVQPRDTDLSRSCTHLIPRLLQVPRTDQYSAVLFPVRQGFLLCCILLSPFSLAPTTFSPFTPFPLSASLHAQGRRCWMLLRSHVCVLSLLALRVRFFFCL